MFRRKNSRKTKNKSTRKSAARSPVVSQRNKDLKIKKARTIFRLFNRDKQKRLRSDAGKAYKIINVPNIFLAGTVLSLLLFGIMMIFSSSALIAYRYYDGDTLYFVKRQIVWVTVGLVLGFLVYRMQTKHYRKLAFWLFLVGIFLLLYLVPEALSPTLENGSKLLEVPFVKTLNGATRWLDFGLFDVQPAEFIKIPIILYIAAWLTKPEKENAQFYKSIKKFKEDRPFFYAISYLIYRFFPFFLTGFVSALILIQKELDTIAIIVVAVFAVMFVSGKDKITTYYISILSFVFGAFAVTTTSYRSARFNAFWQILTQGTPDELVRRAEGFQIWQVLTAIGSGGILGVGFNESRIKRFFLQEAAYTDSIFAIIGEEFGLVGIVILVVAFLFILAQGYSIALNAKDNFEKLVVVGITSLIVGQAFLNIGANLSIIPFGGMPLPFISYGGSTTIMLMIGVAIVLNISRQEIRTTTS